jgi:hypothetical protein
MRWTPGRPRGSGRRCARGDRHQATALAGMSNLGAGYQVRPAGADEVKVRKGILQRARITITREPGGTEIDARGESIRLPIPLYYAINKQMNDRTIAARCADIITHATR